MKIVPFVTVIIPCRNEENYISQVLDNILQQNYPSDKIEVIIADGLSEDKTVEVIENYIDKYSNFHLIRNPEKIVPSALNLAIKNSKGEVIIRMDAHSSYPANYIDKLIYWLEELHADNVGGIWITKPADNTEKAKAIAAALAHPFGVGNALFRIGVKKPVEVDTVPFGCYKREIFERIGLFDEQLIRNQDDEFNARLKKAGGKIYLIPDIQIGYFPRKKFLKLWKMYYQYGYYKPLASKKIGKPSNIRQLAPPLFIASLITLPIFGVWSDIALILFFLQLSLYLIMNIYSSFIRSKSESIKFFISLMISFFILHFSYGSGYLKGLIDFVILKKERRIRSTDITLSR